MPTEQKMQVETPTAFTLALQRMLRPLARLLLHHQVTYPTFIKLIKATYVRVAEEEFPVNGKAQTDSRISLISGVHRKDIRRLRNQDDPTDETPANISLGAQLVAIWAGDESYLNEHNHPRPLPRLTSKSGPSFELLASSINKDIRPRAMLDELLRLGVVSLDENDHVHLNTEAFVPEKGFDEKAFYFGQNLHDHIAAIAHNLAGQSPSFLERSAYCDGLTAESVSELTQLAEEKGMEALLTINRHALRLERRDKDKPDNKQRVNLGLYFYSEHDH